jgi:uncharacterized protein (UPF0335 family)
MEQIRKKLKELEGEVDKIAKDNTEMSDVMDEVRDVLNDWMDQDYRTKCLEDLEMQTSALQARIERAFYNRPSLLETIGDIARPKTLQSLQHNQH